MQMTNHSFLIHLEELYNDKKSKTLTVFQFIQCKFSRCMLYKVHRDSFIVN